MLPQYEDVSKFWVLKGLDIVRKELGGTSEFKPTKTELDEAIENLRKVKYFAIKYQDYDTAAILRDVESKLLSVEIK